MGMKSKDWPGLPGYVEQATAAPGELRDVRCTYVARDKRCIRGANHDGRHRYIERPRG